MEALKGKFERTSAENYEDLLKELSVSWLLRKAALASTPVMEITEEREFLMDSKIYAVPEDKMTGERQMQWSRII